MLWRLELATVWRLNSVAKIACLAETGAVLKLVSVFPRTFVTVHLLSKLPPFQKKKKLCESIFNPHWCFISYPKSSRKGKGFCFLNLIFSFPGFLAAVWVDIVYEILLSYEMGMAGLV